MQNNKLSQREYVLIIACVVLLMANLLQFSFNRKQSKPYTSLLQHNIGETAEDAQTQKQMLETLSSMSKNMTQNFDNDSKRSYDVRMRELDQEEFKLRQQQEQLKQQKSALDASFGAQSPAQSQTELR